ncbi:hypothetical protein ACG3SL_18425 [Sphingomonas sp. CJ20]
MIKKILSAGALAASAVFLVPQASAQTFSPAGSFTITNVGAISVSKGITLSCGLSGSGNVTSGGAASVTGIALSGPLCTSVTFTSTPYAVTASGTTVTINNVTVTAITGNCFGNLSGTYNQSTGILTFVNAPIPSNPAGGSPCRVNGQVRLSPTLTY